MARRAASIGCGRLKSRHRRHFPRTSIIKDLNIGENIFLERAAPLRSQHWEELYSRPRNCSTSCTCRSTTHISRPLGHRTAATRRDRQALSQQARILVLDEPTAARPMQKPKRSFTFFDNLRKRGVGMIYISHKLDEVFRISDRITSWRWAPVGTEPPTPLTKATSSPAWSGARSATSFPKADTSEERPSSKRVTSRRRPQRARQDARAGREFSRCGAAKSSASPV